MDVRYLVLMHRVLRVNCFRLGKLLIVGIADSEIHPAVRYRLKVGYFLYCDGGIGGSIVHRAFPLSSLQLLVVIE